MLFFPPHPHTIIETARGAASYTIPTGFFGLVYPRASYNNPFSINAVNKCSNYYLLSASSLTAGNSVTLNISAGVRGAHFEMVVTPASGTHTLTDNGSTFSTLGGAQTYKRKVNGEDQIILTCNTGSLSYSFEAFGEEFVGSKGADFFKVVQGDVLLGGTYTVYLWKV